MPDRMPSRPTLADVKAAHARIRGAVYETDCDRSFTLSEITGANIWLKFENLQFTSSFKERGALNCLLTLKDADKARGVIAMSAGNHAQGVAYHAQRLAIPAVIVMPEGTPFVKIEATERFGAEVIVTGNSLEEAASAARARAGYDGLFFLHPYNDPAVVAGQGTIALEMLAAVPDLDTLIVPIGSGGLISGIAIAAKALKPGIKIVGVQALRVPAAYNLLRGTELPVHGDTIAEGIAVKAPGELTLEIMRTHIDDILLVEERQIEHAIGTLIEIEKTVVEGAGAVGLAALQANPDRFAGRNVGIVLCGGNIDSRLLASVLTRELARAGRLAELSIDLQDRPGQLARVANIIGRAGANIVEVIHQRTFSDLPAKSAILEVVVETRDRAHLVATIEALRADGFTLRVTSGDAGNGQPTTASAT